MDYYEVTSEGKFYWEVDVTRGIDGVTYRTEVNFSNENSRSDFMSKEEHLFEILMTGQHKEDG